MRKYNFLFTFHISHDLDIGPGSKTDTGLFWTGKQMSCRAGLEIFLTAFFFSFFLFFSLSLFFSFFLLFFSSLSLFSCAQNLGYKIHPNHASINRSVITRHIQNHLSARGYDGSICKACNWSYMRLQVTVLTFQASHPHSRTNTHPMQDRVSTAHYLFFTK